MVEGERARQIGETRRGERKERFCSRTYSTGAQTIWNENKIKSRFDHCQSILGFFNLFGHVIATHCNAVVTVCSAVLQYMKHKHY